MNECWRHLFRLYQGCKSSSTRVKISSPSNEMSSRV